MPTKPVVVVASRETGDLKDLETALYSAGYHVVTATSERETLEKARAHRPDAFIVDRELSPAGLGVSATLRHDAEVSRAAPVIMTQPDTPTAEDAVAAFRAGAWHVQARPIDGHELLLRLGNFLQAKLEIDRLLAESLIDRPSGLYNSHGFTQRAAELAALTRRQGVASACAVFRPDADLPTRGAGDRLGRAFKAVGRLSDAIGRTSQSEFAIFAPATNDWSAARLVRRVRDNVQQEVGYLSEYGKRVTLRAAFSAAIATQKVEPPLLLQRARQALETSS
jgi:CheY-like chemotaxis protein